MKFCKFCGTALQDEQFCNCHLAAEERGQMPVQSTASQPILQVNELQQPVQETVPQQSIPQPMQAAQPAAQVNGQAAPAQQPYTAQSTNEIPTGYGQAGDVPPQPQQIVRTEPSQAGIFFKEILDVFISMFKTPAQAIENVHEKANLAKSFTFLGIQSFVMALAISLIYGRAFTPLYGVFGYSIKFSEYAKAFFGGFFAVSAFSVLLASLFFLFAQIFKKPIEFPKVLSFVAGASVFVSVGTVPVWIFALFMGASYSFSVTMILALWFSVTACASGSLFSMIKKQIGDANTALLVTVCAYFPTILVIGLIGFALL